LKYDSAGALHASSLCPPVPTMCSYSLTHALGRTTCFGTADHVVAASRGRLWVIDQLKSVVYSCESSNQNGAKKLIRRVGTAPRKLLDGSRPISYIFTKLKRVLSHRPFSEDDCRRQCWRLGLFNRGDLVRPGRCEGCAVGNRAGARQRLVILIFQVGQESTPHRLVQKCM